MQNVGATGVTLGVGRPEWLAFPWQGHRDQWAAQVNASGRDYLGEAIRALRQAPDGTRRTIVVTIDTLAPLRIAKDPRAAAVSADGSRSSSFLSASAWRDGAGGDLADVCAEVARRYRPDRLALTELMLPDVFSDEDRALFRKMTGAQDWPRRPDGSVDVAASALNDWRTAIMTDVVRRCRDSAHDVGIPLELDVRAAWDDPTGSRPESGHDYRALLQDVDRLCVWDYFELSGRGPQMGRELTSGLRTSLGHPAMSRITMSVGLWGADRVKDDASLDAGGKTLPPAAMAEGLSAAATNGVQSVSVTPYSLMTDEHWAALRGAWRPAD